MIEENIVTAPAQEPRIVLPRLAVWQAYLLVFISSASGLIIELVASRIMAPYVGTSLYTWTSVIGVTLAGISIGNWLGGRFADRRTASILLHRLYFAGGYACLAIIPLVKPVLTSAYLVNMPIQLRVLSSSLILFFIPSMLFGTISPIVIKLTLQDMKTVGRKVGSIYAMSTVGSIAGTFITGFVLISVFGTTAIVWGVSGLMVLTGVILCVWRTNQMRRALIEAGSVALLFIILSSTLALNGTLQGTCLRESDYYCIRIYDATAPDGRAAKVLALDHLVHNFIITDDSTKSGYGYEQIYGSMAQWLDTQREKIDLLVIGAGGFSFPRYIRTTYPTSTVDAVEIDPVVVDVTKQYLGLAANTDIHIFTEDARDFLNRSGATGKYSMIQGDTFLDVSVPYHLTTYEFNQSIKEALQPNGIYTVTLIDSGTSGHFLRAYIQTLRKTFAHVLLYAPEGSLTSGARSTFVVAATNRTIADPPQSLWPLTPQATLDKYLAQESPLILTDDYAPVDNLLLPVVDRSLDTANQ